MASASGFSTAATAATSILDMIDKQIDQHLDAFLQRDYGAGAFAALAGQRLGGRVRGPRLPRHDVRRGRAVSPRTRPSGRPKTHVQDGIDENLAGDEDDEDDQSEWNWEALAKMANARWGLSLRDRDLKKLGRDNVGEFLIEQARDGDRRRSICPTARSFLEEDFPQRTIVGWAHAQVRPRPRAGRDQEARAGGAQGRTSTSRCSAAYDAEGGRVSGDGRHLSLHASAQGQQARLDREGLVAWARERFDADLDVET